MSHIPFLFRILSIEHVFPLKQVPNLMVVSVHLVMIPGTTYKDADVPNIDAVAPRDLQADLGRPIHVQLHIFVMRDIPRYSRARIAKNRLSDTFGQVEAQRSIDNISINFFTRRGVILFGFDECGDDRVVFNFHKNITSADIYNMISLSSRVIGREETRLYESNALPNGDNQGLEASDKAMLLVSLL